MNPGADIYTLLVQKRDSGSGSVQRSYRKRGPYERRSRTAAGYYRSYRLSERQLRAENPDIPWSDIIGMRNVLIHHYFGIDRDAVWNVVERDLPDLKSQILSRVGG